MRFSPRRERSREEWWVSWFSLTHSPGPARASCITYTSGNNLYILSQPMSWTNHSTAVQNTHAPILSSIRVSLLEMNKKRKTDQHKIQVAVCVCVCCISPTIFVLPSDKRRGRWWITKTRWRRYTHIADFLGRVENSRYMLIVKPDGLLWPRWRMIPW